MGVGIILGIGAIEKLAETDLVGLIVAWFWGESIWLKNRSTLGRVFDLSFELIILLSNRPKPIQS